MKSGCSIFSLLLFALTLNGQVILRLEALKTEPFVAFSWAIDPVSSREKSARIKPSADGRTVCTLDIKSFQTLNISYRNLVQTILVKPGPDTLSLRFDAGKNEWRASSLKDTLYTATNDIDRFADYALLNLGRPGTPAAVRKTKMFADSLRKQYANDDQDIREYVHFTAAFLELSSGLMAEQTFAQKAFNGRMKARMNPAFGVLFHALFDRLLFNAGKQQLRENWSEAFKPSETFKTFGAWVTQHTGVENDTLIRWITLNCLLELNNSASVPTKEMEQLLEQTLTSVDDSLMLDLGAYIKKRIRLSARGNPFPDFSFIDAKTGTLLHTRSFRNKPIYLVYLPSSAPELTQQLFYLNAFQAKYGKEIVFIGLVNHSSRANMASLAKKQGFTFLLAAFDECEGFVTEVLESENSSSYVLVDKKGLIWQSPAEGPETGVEASFLNLMKQ
jgi:peroxiredoxin